MRKILTTVLSVTMLCGVANAIPAKRVPMTVTQSDGSTITVEMRGDEFHHSFVTKDGLAVARAENGDFYYRTVTGVSSQMAHDPASRDGGEAAFVNAQKANMTLSALAVTNPQSKIRRGAPRKVGSTQVPTTGSPRVPILLVDYKDKKMKHVKSDFVAQYTSGSTSSYQYFADQSNGKYTPQFDVYGIYTLNSNRSTYGGNNYWGNDKGVARMVGEAVDKASQSGEIDWSQYDNDGDGEADVVIVVYAGVGEAQASSVSDAVWPCQWSLSSGGSSGDGTGARTYNNTKIDRFAVFNEINGSSDNGTRMDGIGTFCHEFSHCLGLPDFYDTRYGGHNGMGSWSLMDYGSYNNDGYTPIGYDAYEKDFMGWINLISPKPNTKYTLPVWNQKDESTDKAVKIVSNINKNEYYIVENRKAQGWDSYIADKRGGALITHVSYVPSRWEDNTPNNQDVQLMTYFPADNSMGTWSESADLYGKSNHELTDKSSPKAELYLNKSGTATSHAGYMGKPLTEINVNSDSSVSFWYIKSDGPAAGDINEDGKVDAGDVTTLVNYILGLHPNPCNLSVADLNEDGHYDASDVTELVNLILGR